MVLETETASGTKVVMHLTKTMTPTRNRADLMSCIRMTA